MGGRGTSFTAARSIVGQYELSDITDSKSKIVSFFKKARETGGIKFDEESGSIQITRAAYNDATELAEELSDRMVYRDEQALQDYRDIRRLVSGTYRLSDQERSNITDLSQYIRSKENMIRISRNGMDLDTKYQELANMYPQYFDSSRVTSPSEQLEDINNVLRNLRDSTIPLPKSDRAEAAKDMRDDLIRAFISTRRKRA